MGRIAIFFFSGLILLEAVQIKVINGRETFDHKQTA